MDVQITGLYCYPIKSCAGVAQDTYEFSRKGFIGDRQWAIIDSQGHVLTQRTCPKLACIQPGLTPEGLVLKHKNGTSVVSEIEVQTPQASASVATIKVWKDSAEGQVCASEVNDWITAALGSEEPLRLVHYLASSKRLPGYPDRFGADATHFADAAPFLVANAFSLRALNLMLENKRLPLVDIRHFRPNIVFSGLPGFAEQHAITMQRVDDGLTLRLVDPCQRCAVITVDPHTGTRLPKSVPFSQLAELNPMPDNPKAPAFGMNAALTDPDAKGSMAVGERWCLDF